MKLSNDAKAQFDFSIQCYQDGLVDELKLITGLREIYKAELNRQSDFLIAQGFSAAEAWNHIYNADSGEQIL